MIVWVQTVPFYPRLRSLSDILRVGALCRYFLANGGGLNEDEINDTASLIMKELGVQQIVWKSDLVRMMRKEQRVFDVHFPEDFYVQLARPIAAFVEENFLNGQDRM